MSVLAEYYQRHHAGEGGFRRYGFTIRGDERSRWFAQRLGAGNRLLDLGCRDGTMTSSFAPGNEVTGIDIDESALEVARAQLGISTRVVNLNAELLPFEDGTFDAVVAGEILEHLQFPDLVIAEVWRVLRSGGVFCGSVPNAFRLWNRLLFLLAGTSSTTRRTCIIFLRQRSRGCWVASPPGRSPTSRADTCGCLPD